MKKIILITFLALIGVLALFTGCGEDSNGVPAPEGTTILINPDGDKVTTTTGACIGTNVSIPFTITVFDAEGERQNNIQVRINLSWAPNSAVAGLQVMQLYNKDGYPVTVPFETKTNELGIVDVTVVRDISCEYKGNLSASAGSAFELVELETLSN
jgi:hypothetical protein